MFQGANIAITNLADLRESDKLREEGNKLFKEKKYFPAMTQYNKALLFCSDDPSRAALCYGNRSAVYFHLGYLHHCLHNIDLAEPNYPASKIQKLHDRRRQCDELLLESPEADKAVEPFKHTSKLSYDANEKLPFFIDALQLGNFNDEIGRGLITTRDLKAGDVIAVFDQPMRLPVNNIAANHILACYHCFKVNNGDLIPGGKCELINYGSGLSLPGECKAFFCSEECRSEHMKDHEINHDSFHQIEMQQLKNQTSGETSQLYIRSCLGLANDARMFLKMFDAFGNVKEMKKFAELHKDKDYTVFDFDWSNLDVNDPVYYKNLLLMVLSLEYDPLTGGKSSEDEFRDRGGIWKDFCKSLKSTNRMSKIFLNQSCPENIKFLDKLMTHIHYATLHRNSLELYGCKMPDIAIFTHPALFVMNHSCDPNVIYHIEDGRRLVWTVSLAIRAGERVCFPHVNSNEDGLQCLTHNMCVPCVKKLDVSVDKKELQKTLEVEVGALFSERDPMKLSSWLKIKEECCECINMRMNEKYHQNYKQRRLIALRKKVLEMTLIDAIGDPFPPTSAAARCKLTSVEKIAEFNKMLAMDWVGAESLD